MTFIAVFFMDFFILFYYSEPEMLNGMRIYSSDKVWRQILTDLHANVTDTKIPGVIDFDALNINLATPITPLKLKSLILNAHNNSDIIRKLFNDDVQLPDLQEQILILLYKTGGMTVSELKTALGYCPGVTTHTVDTAIYLLRKAYGHDFIQNKNGIYTIGRI